ncbi:MAG: hypothetical protein AB1427_00230 [Thermodesulfobacteriota bacterium]
MKPENRIIGLVGLLSVCMALFGAAGYAPAGESAFSGALNAGPAPDAPAPTDTGSEAAEIEALAAGFRPAPNLMLYPDEWRPNEWAPAKTTGPQSFFRPEDLYAPDDDIRPLLGIDWEHEAGRRNKWNVVFGLGFYISNYDDRNQPAVDLGPEEPAAEREPMDLFEKLINAMQVVGFQVRYEF